MKDEGSSNRGTIVALVVIALLVAIPAMFGYNFILTSIRSLIVQMDNFAAELESEFEHKYVSHGSNWSARLAR